MQVSVILLFRAMLVLGAKADFSSHAVESPDTTKVGSSVEEVHLEALLA